MADNLSDLSNSAIQEINECSSSSELDSLRVKYLGKKGIDEMILTMNQRAKQFANEIEKITGFYVENEIVFNQVIVRCDSDKITENVLVNIQQLRECWLGGSIWFEKKVMRVSICSWATTESDITKAVKSFEKALEISKK